MCGSRVRRAAANPVQVPLFWFQKQLKALALVVCAAAVGKSGCSGSHFHQGLAGDVRGALGSGKNDLGKSFGAVEIQQE